MYSSDKRYENDLKGNFWSVAKAGFDVEPDNQILKVI